MVGAASGQEGQAQAGEGGREGPSQWRVSPRAAAAGAPPQAGGRESPRREEAMRKSSSRATFRLELPQRPLTSPYKKFCSEIVVSILWTHTLGEVETLNTTCGP
jgi:hypothetical protein